MACFLVERGNRGVERQPAEIRLGRLDATRTVTIQTICRYLAAITSAAVCRGEGFDLYVPIASKAPQ